ncbi:hypothetical protein D9M72_459020 [compost metagenome]
MHVTAIGIDLEQLALRQIIAADGVGRQHGAEFRHGAQHVGDEGVGVRARPDPIAAGCVIGIACDRRFDLRDQPAGFGSGDRNNQSRLVRIPARIGRIGVAADRLAPADLVVAVVGEGALLLGHDPGVAGDGALHAAGRCRKDVDPRIGALGCLRQDARRGPVGRAPALWPVLHVPPAGRG